MTSSKNFHVLFRIGLLKEAEAQSLIILIMLFLTWLVLIMN
jgi:hypothetical protein